MVSLTKAQHIELVMQANYWQSLRGRCGASNGATSALGA
jgi:hypothetical protein